MDPLSTPPRRTLGLTDATLITVGAMVGSGIFSAPTEVARLAGSPFRAMAVWIVAAAVSLLGALCVAELGAALPHTGGLYVYLRRAYGPLTAYVFGWTMLTVLVPSAGGFYAEVTAQHLAPALGLSPTVVAIAVIALVALVNVLGVREAAAVQSLTTATRTAALAVVGIAAFAVPAVRTVVHTVGTPSPGVLVAAVVPALWAYDGWIDVTSIAGEIRRPTRNVPLALLCGTLTVTVLYVLMVGAYVHALGFDTVAHATALGSDLGVRLAGDLGRRGLSAIVALSTFGGSVLAVLTGTRVVYAMGADGTFVPALGVLSSRGTPARAVAVTSLLAMAYVIVPGMNHLADVFVLGAWPFYALGAVAVVVLRRREPLLPRPFRVPGYPWPVVGFVLATVGLLVGSAHSQLRPVLLSLGGIALGVPVYAVLRRRGEPATFRP